MINDKIEKKINIRKIKCAEDYDAIYEITSQSWKPIYDYRNSILDEKIFISIYKDGPINKAEQVKKWCTENTENVRVAEIGKKIVGFITWIYDNPAKGHVELSNNAVTPSMQRMGIGLSMYNWFFKFIKKRGYLYVNVFTGLDPAHKGARKAYEKLGFGMSVGYVKYYKEL